MVFTFLVLNDPWTTHSTIFLLPVQFACVLDPPALVFLWTCSNKSSLYPSPNYRTWCKSTNVSMIASWVSATASDDEVVTRMQLAESWHFLHCLVSPWSQSQYKSLYCSSEASFMAFSIGHFLAKCDVNVSGTEWYSFSFGYLQSSTHPWWSYRSYTCNLINDRQLNDHIRVHGTHYLRVCCRSASTSFPAFTAD